MLTLCTFNFIDYNNHNVTFVPGPKIMITKDKTTDAQKAYWLAVKRAAEYFNALPEWKKKLLIRP